MQTENTYVETDLGNIALNPRGEYSGEASYEHLDTVSYMGGSYVCLAELTKTISGIAPAQGENTEHWQMLTLPGQLTPEAVAMHDDVVNKAKQVETSRAAVELSQQEVEAAQADVTQMRQDTQEASEEAIASRDSAAGYAQSAEASRTAAAESEQNINAQVAGFDTHVAKKTSEAESAITEARRAAVSAVSTKQDNATQAVTDEGDKQIKKVEDAGTEQVGKAKSAGASAVSAAGAAGMSAVNAVKAQQTASIKAVADEGTQQVTAVNTAGSTQVSTIETKGADRVKAIQEAGKNALQNISNGVDKGLSEEGKAADAKATGEAISKLTEDLGNYELKNDLAVVNYEFEHFGYISSNGENISSTENAKYTNFIRVHAGDKFEVKAPIGDAGYSIACYDSNEKILIDSSVKGNYSGLFTVPEGVEFIRCSFYGLKNTAYCRSCPKYNFPELKAYVSSNIDEINNFGIKLEGLKPQFTEKGYLMTTDGTVGKSDYGKCTDFIYIPRDATNIKNHTVNGDYTVASVCFYDSEKNYIASLTTTERDVDIDITAEEYSSAEYVRLSYYNYKSDDSIGPNGIIYNKESVEIRFSKVDERIKNIEGFGSANLNVLIFGDSITDCASFTVSNDVTTKYNFSGMNTYINANGETIKYKMWPKIFESKMKCKDLRNYARSGASYKNDARESGEERRNLSYQIQLAINDVDNAGGAFNQSHFEPDIIIFALGTNDGVPNDTPASAYSKIITTGTGIDVSATLSNLDMSKFCESVIYAYMQIRKYFPYAMIFNVLPIQRMANDVPLGTAHDYLKEISQKIANAIIIDGAYESGIIKQNNLVSGLGETLKDGLHPNEKGQNMMARMIISKVKSHYVSFDNMND